MLKADCGMSIARTKGVPQLAEEWKTDVVVFSKDRIKKNRTRIYTGLADQKRIKNTLYSDL